MQPLNRLVLMSMACFGSWLILSSFTALHSYTALHGMYGWYNGLWNNLNYLLLFYLATVLPIDRLKVLKAIVIVTALIAVYAILQKYKLDIALYQFLKFKTAILFLDYKPSSTIGNPVILAVCLMLALPFSMYFAIKHKGLKSIFYTTTSILFLVAIILTQARAVVLAIVVTGAVMIFIFSWRRFALKGIGYIVISSIPLVVLLLILFSAFISPATKNRWNPNNILQDDTIKLRIIYTETAYRMLIDKPIRLLTGIGQENFYIAYPLYRTPEAINLEPNSMPTQTHNGYLNYIIEGGIPLLIFYLGFIITVLKNINRNDRLLGMAFTASIMCFLLQAFTGWATISVMVFFYAILGMSVKNDKSRTHA